MPNVTSITLFLCLTLVEDLFTKLFPQLEENFQLGACSVLFQKTVLKEIIVFENNTFFLIKKKVFENNS